MAKFIVTFGYGHQPSIGYFCRIKAKTMMDARLKMNEITHHWAGIYSSEEEAGVNEWNLKEVSLGEVRKVAKECERQ